MNVKSKENVENSAVELIIEVGAQEFEAALDKVYKKQRGSIAVPGFRKGKAPRKIIEGMYGSGVFYEDAIEELYPSAYAEAVEQEKLDVVAYPKVEVLEVGKDGFTFKAVVTVRPEAKIGTYKGLSAEKEAVAVTDEDIENELKPYVERATRLVNVEREAKMGDTVLLDFEGFDNGVPFEGGKAENHALELGSHSFVPGFEEGVVGLKPGDEKDIDVTFPEDYHADLAGKPVVFKIKVHEVKEPQAPVVDDEFAKDVSEFDTLEEFKKDYLDRKEPMHFRKCRITDTETADGEFATLVKLTYTDHGIEKYFDGIGNGPIDAVQRGLEEALGIQIKVLDYTEHALASGSGAQAASYIHLVDQSTGKATYGVGISSNITRASIRGIFSAVNRLFY